MTTINSVNATTQTTSTTTRTTTTETPSDYDTFLTLLTAQLKYQDPLDPADSSEFAVQLATFSGVEQQVLTNENLSSLLAQMSVSGLGEMASWVGREARAPVDAYFDGSPVTISPNPAALADRAELIVRDNNGTEVQRMPIPVSSDPIEWAGVTTDGAPLPKGVYAFEIASYSKDEEILREKAEIYATVEEVRSKDGETYLVLAGDVTVASRAVTALRDPG
jgi:flagellar basal-body rod modification protein FlgD